MIRNTFVMLPSVGAKKERTIWESGIRTWDDFISSDIVPTMRPEAKERGITKVSLSVRADNERAKAFYRRNGFVSEGMDTRLFSIDGEYVDGERFGLIL